MLTVDERRKNIEALPPEMYDRLSYYERWIMSLTQSLIERGVITTEELARKMLDVGGARPPRHGRAAGGQGRARASTSYADWERRVDALMCPVGHPGRSA